MGFIYPDTCHPSSSWNITEKPNVQASWRIVTNNSAIKISDTLQKPIIQCLKSDIGDFIVKRADNLYAYQLVVVIDDFLQKVTEIVRGIDIYESTPRQVHLQQLLDYPTPTYLHLPVIVFPDGHKLSKQSHAPAIDTSKPSQLLFQVFKMLKMKPPEHIKTDNNQQCWEWAIQHWSPDRLKGIKAIICNSA